MQKSMNIAVQKQSYSGQKKAPLFKPKMCVFLDGYIREIFTFNAAVANDASIIRSIANTGSQFSCHFMPKDVFIFDRGFCDVVPEFWRRNFYVYTPALGADREQLSWKEANKTRRVTKVSWVVEAVNGRHKTPFRALHHIVQNTNIGSKLVELKICCPQSSINMVNALYQIRTIQSSSLIVSCRE